MPFNPPESSTYINIKLTDAGRRMLSLGQLQFVKAVVSDREIDYGIDRSGLYDIQNNRVLGPVDDYPSVDPVNLDGTNAITLDSQQLISVKQFNTAQTATSGLFSGFINNWTINYTLAGQYGKGFKSVVYATNSANFGTNTIQFQPGGATVLSGDLVHICWVPNNWLPPGSFPTTISTPLLLSGYPYNGLWYRVVSAGTVANTFLLDRPIPDLSAGKTVGAYVYPYNSIETTFGTGFTQQTKFWNMNIVRTSDVPGTNTIVYPGLTGYSAYGSIEYAGTKHYLGFDADYPAIGIIHYTNKFSGETYAEQLVEKSIQINIPNIMWHMYPSNNGEGSAFGLTLYDMYGNTFYDGAARTTYRELRDGLQSSNKVVGRVYHKLKMFVITDQELLTVLSYKSNRNYTLPEPIVTLQSNPRPPLTSSDVTGLCSSGKTYFVSYLMEVNPAGPSSFGFTNPLHCGYIKKIDGELDINGNPQYLSVQFPTNSFPYMRNAANLILTGSGWNANRMSILVNEVDSDAQLKAGNVSASTWIVMTGDGRYDSTINDPNTPVTIDPVALNSYQFIMSREDYISGSTYVMWSGHTSNERFLSFGDESFFFGTIDAQVFNTVYKTIVTVIAANYEYNSSNNDTFDSNTDDYTYITEVAILDGQNQTVAVGKPTYPLRKSDARFLAFQLQIDF